MIRTIRYTGILAILLVLCMVMPAQAEDAAYWVDAATGARLESLDTVAGQDVTVRLMADVPAGKTLKAYSFMVMYDDAALDVADAAAVKDAALAPATINADADGEIFANGFDLNGVAGDADGVTIALLDVTLKANGQGESYITVLFSNFGASADDEFKPEIGPFKVKVN